MKQQAHLIQVSETQYKPSAPDSAGGVEVYESLGGNFYMVDTVVNATGTNYTLVFRACENMKSFSAPNWTSLVQINENPNLETLLLPRINKSIGNYQLQNNPKLKTCQLGSVGHPITGITSMAMRYMPQSDLTITVYVDASSIADVPANVKNNAPWGATNATIIYRSSITGEILS